MSRTDLRGFDYTLEPVRQRAHHRVDAAIGALGQRQQALAKARVHAEDLRGQCDDVARRSTPAQRAAIDPWRAMAASRQWLQLREALAQAEQAVSDSESAVGDAQRQLEQARVEQETFDAHREEALAEHRRTLTQRQQTQADQDWLARAKPLTEARRET
jgi:flagellar export protein FliJ